MFKEIKYLIYLLVIAFFFIFTVRYYISDDYKKKYYRGLESNKDKTITYAKNLPTLKMIQIKFLHTLKITIHLKKNTNSGIC